MNKKKKEREKLVRQKMIRRKEKDLVVKKAERSKAKLAHESRRRNQPIVKHRLADSDVPMSQERNIEIHQENLAENLSKLREMEKELVQGRNTEEAADVREVCGD